MRSRPGCASCGPRRSSSARWSFAFVVLGIQQFQNFLTLGAIYALVALGYTMVYGIIELINFAHGDVFMVSAFLSMWIISVPLGLADKAIDDPVR